MGFTFEKEGWTPNYVNYSDIFEKKHLNTDIMFLKYVEDNVQMIKIENIIHVRFVFGEKIFIMPCIKLEELLYALKRHEGDYDSTVEIAQPELIDFMVFFGLIEKTTNGYLMVKDSLPKLGNASLATLLGHILVEKHFPYVV